ncbi:MAG: 4Fe-4S binding protein [Chloroflexi bacterium]|nr:4Fe-4S binding protein [Chloroflexota bacterium]
MIRKIIQIDNSKCDGCGQCAEACHEGAIGLSDGKAILLRDDYCDGLGDCLPLCPKGAISFTMREANAYDYQAVLQHLANAKAQQHACLGSMACNIQQPVYQESAVCNCPSSAVKSLTTLTNDAHYDQCIPSCLAQWPIQIKLTPANAPYFAQSHVLIAADCCAYAYGNFHQDYMKNNITVIGCPKLDEEDYSQKLAEILSYNDIKALTIARMEVPCCSGLQSAVQNALQLSNYNIPLKVVVISIDGKILNC